MHGLIFAALRDFLTSRVGQERTDELFAAAPPYLMSAAYPDDDFLQLVERGRAAADEPLEEFLRSFGAFTGSHTFPRLYPAFYAVAGGTRTFLLTVEDRIHELVRATIPDAAPPQLHVEPAAEQRLRITYDSPRRLCPFVDGLLVGTAACFDEQAVVTERACARRGDPACVFELSLPDDG